MTCGGDAIAALDTDNLDLLIVAAFLRADASSGTNEFAAWVNGDGRRVE